MFDKQLTFVNKTFKDKADAINFLIHEAAAAGKMNGGEAYRKSVLQREEEFSTAVGYEVAIPHGSSDDVTESFVAVSTVKKPILWGEESVRMIFMMSQNIKEPENICRFLPGLVETLCMMNFAIALLMQEMKYNYSNV